MPFTLSFPFWVSAKNNLPTTIKDINAEELNKERLKLENEERRLAKEIIKVQTDRSLALQEYHAARENGEEHQAKLVARRIKNIENQLGGLDFRHNTLNKQQRMTSGLIVLKENEAFISNLADSSHLNSMDMVELQSWVEQATEEGELTNEHLEDMISTMDVSFDSSSLQNDKSMDDYMASLDNEVPVAISTQVASSKALDDTIEDSIAQVDKRIDQVTKVISEPTAS